MLRVLARIYLFRFKEIVIQTYLTLTNSVPIIYVTISDPKFGNCLWKSMQIYNFLQVWTVIFNSIFYIEPDPEYNLILPQKIIGKCGLQYLARNII